VKGALEYKNGKPRSEDRVLNVLIDLFESFLKLKTFYDKLMGFENELISDCASGKCFEAGQYAGKVANLRKDIEELMTCLG